MLSLQTSQVAHKFRAYPGFLRMKRLAVFPLPPGCDASPLHWVNPRVKFTGTKLYTWMKRALQRELNVLPKNTTQFPQPGLQPEQFNPEIRTQAMPVV